VRNLADEIARRMRWAFWSWSQEERSADEGTSAARRGGDTVLLRRADYEALLRQAEAAADAAQIREAEARVEAGEDEYVPIELTGRLVAGEVPVRVWREHRGMSRRALAGRAGISAAWLSQIETGRKPGSFDAMAKLARALGVDMEDLEPWRP